MSTDPALVSVVIPTYNYGHCVAEAVDSALGQTYPAVEVLVIDDGSTDDTRQRLAGYGDRIRYIHQPNAGLSAARNTGIRAARGAFVALLDSDDAFHPRKLELQMGYLTSHPEVPFLAADQLDGPTQPPWPTLTDSPPVRRVGLDELVVKARFGPGGVVVRKDCFDRVGLFDESLRSVEDRDMWIRLATRFSIGLMQSPLWWYRSQPGSMSRNAEKMTHYERVVLDKAFAMPELNRRRLLRRKAMGLATYSAAYMFVENGRPGTAAKLMAQSVAWWPIPFRPPDVRMPLARARLAARVARVLASPRPRMTGHAPQPTPTTG
ncbi:MAG TPA: glycosyltransferase [Fimbriiglobus sp.]|nr:glycosyltransferase [Fimbriiglobus sp.]